MPRSIWIDAIRGDLQSNDPRVSSAVAAADVVGEVDLNDPVPVIRLLNRQQAGERIDPTEAFEVLAEIESVVIGDVDDCRAKLEAYAALGADRLMCLMCFGMISRKDVLRSIQIPGDALIPAVSDRG